MLTLPQNFDEIPPPPPPPPPGGGGGVGGRCPLWSLLLGSFLLKGTGFNRKSKVNFQTKKRKD